MFYFIKCFELPFVSFACYFQRKLLSIHIAHFSSLLKFAIASSGSIRCIIAVEAESSGASFDLQVRAKTTALSKPFVLYRRHATEMIVCLILIACVLDTVIIGVIFSDGKHRKLFWILTHLLYRIRFDQCLRLFPTPKLCYQQEQQ